MYSILHYLESAEIFLKITSALSDYGDYQRLQRLFSSRFNRCNLNLITVIKRLLFCLGFFQQSLLQRSTESSGGEQGAKSSLHYIFYYFMSCSVNLSLSISSLSKGNSILAFSNAPKIVCCHFLGKDQNILCISFLSIIVDV